MEKKKFPLSFRKLTLTQQVTTLIILMFAFLALFFVFFLSNNLKDAVSSQIYSMMESEQEPIVQALENGRKQETDPELFELLAADPFQNVGLIYDNQQIMFSAPTSEASEDFQDYLYQQAMALGKLPNATVEKRYVDYKGTPMYYVIQQVRGEDGKTSFVFSYMGNQYADELRTTLMDSTIYVIGLAFFLVLLIFLLWVFSIIHPLNQIKSYIAQVKQGKDVELYIDRDDEIGEVAKELRTLKEELEKQERSKEEMIHNISHDLKTPIATIKSYAESIKDGIYPYGDLDSSVDVILENTDRLEHKVHNLLYMNRVEYLVSSDAEGVTSNMKDVVEKVFLNAAMIRPEIDLQTDVEEVYFDGLFESWRVTLENLLENAFRYAKSYIRITVRENEMIVANDGPKMDESRIGALFQPFIKGEGGNFGLGLSIVNKVVQANKYKVEGVNTEDGVAFRIWREVPKQKKKNNGRTGAIKNKGSNQNMSRVNKSAKPSANTTQSKKKPVRYRKKGK